MIIINQVSVYEGLRDLLFLTKLPPTHREEPFVFQIGRKQMIEGWEKGLLNMCVGEKRKLVVPSDMVSLFVLLGRSSMYESKQASDGISLPLIVFCLFCTTYRHMVPLVVLAQSL